MAWGAERLWSSFFKVDPQVKSIVFSGYSDEPVMAEF
jgi:hypothetical protein